MAVGFYNNWENILKKLQSLLRIEFGSALKVYVNLTNNYQDSNYMIIRPMSSELEGYFPEKERRQYAVDIRLYYKQSSLEKKDIDQVMRTISRIETVTANNSSMLLSDGSYALGCTISNTEINNEDPEELNVVLNFICNHTNDLATDTTAPTASIVLTNSSGATINSGAYSTDSPVTITFTISEHTNDFTADDVTITNGTMSSFSGSGTSYTATLTPVDGTVVVTCPADRFQDNAGNFNTATSFSYTSVPSVYSASFPDPDDGSSPRNGPYIDCGTGLCNTLGDNYTGDLSVSLWFKGSGLATHSWAMQLFQLGGEFHDSGTTSSSTKREIIVKFNIDATNSIRPSYLQLSLNDAEFWKLNSTGVWDTRADDGSATGWHHFVLVYKGRGDGTSESAAIAATKMYLNGVALGIANSDQDPASDFPTTTEMDFASGKLIIGAATNSNYVFDGLIDEFAVFNDDLSAANVLSLYNNGSPNDLRLAASYDSSKTSNLKAYYRMEEGSGSTVVDLSGEGNTGTLTNGCTFSTDVPSPYSSYAMQFTGTTDSGTPYNSGSFMELPRSANWMGSSGEFAISLWFKVDALPESTTDYGGVLIASGSNAYTSSSNGDIYVAVNFSDATTFESGYMFFKKTNSGTDTEISIAGAFTAGTWHHLLLTSSDTIARIYIDGVLKGSDTDVASDRNTNNIFLGGTHTTDRKWFKGYVDEVSIYNVDKSSVRDKLLNNGIPRDVTYESGTQGYWKFEQASGDDMDDLTQSGDTTNGNNNGGTWVTNNHKGVTYTPFNRYAIYFDGSGDYITIANHADINFGTGDFSISCWVNIDTAPPTSDLEMILMKGDTAGVGKNYHIQAAADGSDNLSFKFYMDDNSAVSGVTTATTSLDTWYHICVTCDRDHATGLKIYTNGSGTVVSGDPRGTANTLDDTDEALRFGKRSPDADTSYLNGYLSHVAFWKGKALSASEVDIIYNGGIPSDVKLDMPTSLSGYWKLQGDANDSQGSKNGTVTNATFKGTQVPTKYI